MLDIFICKSDGIVKQIKDIYCYYIDQISEKTFSLFYQSIRLFLVLKRGSSTTFTVYL